MIKIDYETTLWESTAVDIICDECECKERHMIQSITEIREILIKNGRSEYKTLYATKHRCTECTFTHNSQPSWNYL